MRNLSTQRLQSLLEASRVLSSTLDLDRLLTLIPDLSRHHLAAENGILYLVDEVRQEFWSRTMRGNRLLEVRGPLRAGISGLAFRTGEVLNIADAGSDPRFDKRVDGLGAVTTRSLLVVPVRTGGRVGGIWVSVNKRGGRYTPEDEEFTADMAEQVGVVLENVRVHRAALAEERAVRDLEVAGEIQQRLLPVTLPVVHGYQVSASAVPAHTVGGDFYDVVALADGIVVVTVADVSGKGIPAALLMASLHASYRAYIEGATGLVDLACRLNEIVALAGPEGRYVGLVLVALDTGAHRLSYVNAGHVPPLVFRSSTEQFERLEASGPPLGLVRESSYEQQVLELHRGDIAVLYSDGITSVTNRKQEIFGEDRLRRRVGAEADRSAGDIHAAVLQELAAFARDSSPLDDTTLVVVKRL